MLRYNFSLNFILNLFFFNSSHNTHKTLRIKVPPMPKPFTTVYLDKLSTSAHRPRAKIEGEDDSWRKTLIQIIPVPDLTHTGIKSSFTTTNAPENNLLRPDGSVSNALRREIVTELANLPRESGNGVYDVLDMTYRDKERRREKADTVSNRPAGSSNSNSRQNTDNKKQTLSTRKESTLGMFSLSDTKTKSIRSIAIPAKGTLGERPKKPFSESSLFNALLDVQIGDGGEAWNLMGYEDNQELFCKSMVYDSDDETR